MAAEAPRAVGPEKPSPREGGGQGAPRAPHGLLASLGAAGRGGTHIGRGEQLQRDRERLTLQLLLLPPPKPLLLVALAARAGELAHLARLPGAREKGYLWFQTRAGRGGRGGRTCRMSSCSLRSMAACRRERRASARRRPVPMRGPKAGAQLSWRPADICWPGIGARSRPTAAALMARHYDEGGAGRQHYAKGDEQDLLEEATAAAVRLHLLWALPPTTRPKVRAADRGPNLLVLCLVRGRVPPHRHSPVVAVCEMRAVVASVHTRRGRTSGRVRVQAPRASRGACRQACVASTARTMLAHIERAAPAAPSVRAPARHLLVVLVLQWVLSLRQLPVAGEVRGAEAALSHRAPEHSARNARAAVGRSMMRQKGLARRREAGRVVGATPARLRCCC